MNKKEKEIYYKEIDKRTKKYEKEKTKILTTIAVIIVGVTLLSLGIIFVRNTISEQSYCSNHEEDCECSLKGCKSLSPFVQGLEDKDCLDISKEDSICPVQTCDICKEWKKKNPCQIKLEKLKDEGKDKLVGYSLEKVSKDYAENCICEEYEKLFLINYGCDSELQKTGISRAGAMSKSCGFEDVKEANKRTFNRELNCNEEELKCEILKDYKYSEKCIKAREKTECEKGNPNYIKERKCFGTENCNKNIYEDVCRKKEINDLSCEELNKAIECNNKVTWRYSYKKCFGSELGWSFDYNENDKLLLQMIKKGCGLTTKE